MAKMGGFAEKRDPMDVATAGKVSESIDDGLLGRRVRELLEEMASSKGEDESDPEALDESAAEADAEDDDAEPEDSSGSLRKADLKRILGG